LRIICSVTKEKELIQIVDKIYGKYFNMLLENDREEGRKIVLMDESRVQTALVLLGNS
jgi:hypothetical protein